MRIHLDGDMLKYSCGFAAEKGEYILSYINELGDEVQEAFTYKKDVTDRVKRLGSPPHSIEFARRPEPVSHALQNVKEAIKETVANVGSDDVVVYLSGPTNFRNSLGHIRIYKGNRDPDHKPVHSGAILDYLRANYPNNTSVDEEADDVMAYTHYAMWKVDPNSTLIASFDKDLDMIPGLHYNNKRKETYLVTPEDADYFFYKQLLTGDSTDNVQGVPGIGPKKAEKYLKGTEHSPEEMYHVCRLLYDDDAALLENARLLWIRREPGQMWEPPVLELTT